MPADKPNSIANHTYEAHVSSMTALVGGAVIKNAPRVLHKFNVVVDDTAGSDVYYLHIRDQASIPGDSGSAITDFLVPPYPVNHTTGTPTSFDLDMSNYGIKSETGLIWYLSTAQFTKTIAGAVAVAFGLIDKPL